MNSRKRAGTARLQNMVSYDELVERASEDNRLTLDRIGPRLSKQTQVEILLDELHSFPNHPFRVVDDEAMQSLSDSIENRGVLHPIVVRNDPKGGYQIISGHRRRFACEKAGLKTIPAYITDLDDDEAIIFMTDANFYQREGLLPSEKAKAYRMKSDAIKRHQGASNGRHTIDEIGEGTTDSSTQIKRFIRLSYLTDDLLWLIDTKKLSIDQGVQISYLSESWQKTFYEIFTELTASAPLTVSILQAKEIREAAESGKFSKEEILSILLQKDTQKRKVTLKTDTLQKYFSDSYSATDIEEIILNLLEKWKEGETSG